MDRSVPEPRLKLAAHSMHTQKRAAIACTLLTHTHTHTFAPLPMHGAAHCAATWRRGAESPLRPPFASPNIAHNERLPQGTGECRGQRYPIDRSLWATPGTDSRLSFVLIGGARCDRRHMPSNKHTNKPRTRQTSSKVHHALPRKRPTRRAMACAGTGTVRTNNHVVWTIACAGTRGPLRVRVDHVADLDRQLVRHDELAQLRLVPPLLLAVVPRLKRFAFSSVSDARVDPIRLCLFAYEKVVPKGPMPRTTPTPPTQNMSAYARARAHPHTHTYAQLQGNMLLCGSHRYKDDKQRPQNNFTTTTHPLAADNDVRRPVLVDLAQKRHRVRDGTDKR